MQVDSLDINLEHVMFVIVRMWPRVFSAHWLKAQHLAVCKLAMQNADEILSNRCAARWRRMLLKAQQRAMWHVQGLFLWLVQRPSFEKKVTPAVALMMGGAAVARSKAGQLVVEAAASKSAPSMLKARHLQPRRFQFLF